MTAPRVGVCKSCSARIFFGTMASGQVMPFDAVATPSGSWMILRFDGPTPVMHHAAADFTGDRYVTHFATCSNASEHRRKRSRRPVATVPAR